MHDYHDMMEKKRQGFEDGSIILVLGGKGKMPKDMPGVTAGDPAENEDADPVGEMPHEEQDAPCPFGALRDHIGGSTPELTELAERVTQLEEDHKELLSAKDSADEASVTDEDEDGPSSYEKMKASS